MSQRHVSQWDWIVCGTCCSQLLIQLEGLFDTPSISKQKLHLDIICVTKQKVHLVKFLSNFIKRTRMLPETISMMLLMNYQVNQLTIYTYLTINIWTQPKTEHQHDFMCAICQWRWTGMLSSTIHEHSYRFLSNLKEHKSQPHCSLANELWCHPPKMTGFQ